MSTTAPPCSTTARPVFLFPGLGAEHLGMGADLAARFPGAKRCYERASAVLGFDLARVCFEGPEDALREELTAQAAVLVTSLAAHAAIEEGTELRPAAAAGHSLGLYSAYAAAGILTIEDALRALVRAWELMNEHAPAFECGMGVVEGLDASAVEGVVAMTDRVWIANRNAPNHFVLSGAREWVERALGAAKARGAFAAKLLPTRLAVHSPLVEAACIRFREWVATIPMADPAFPVADALRPGLVTDAARARAVLGDLLARPILWEATIRRLGQEGFGSFLETGPKKGLRALVRRILPEASCRHAEEVLRPAGVRAT